MSEQPIKRGLSLHRDHYDLAYILHQAFDYRGDVQIHLKSGTILEGYVFNYSLDLPQPILSLFPQKSSEKQEIPADEVLAISFSGRDMAEGKHWEFWLEKCKRREVAQARGESALEEMSLFPESLEDA